ncbi:MAG: PadR family transcriptional regulator [Candidatus Thorarchaeota archaeon]
MPKDSSSTQEICESVRMPHSMPRGFLRLVILRLLKNREMSGTDIMNILDERTEGRWQPSPGSMYPMLSSLEATGSIEVVRTEGRSKIYKISEAGLEQLRATFKNKGDLGEKASMGPRLWEKLLEPVDRARFNATVIGHHFESLSEVIEQLTDIQKQKLLQHLELHKEQLGKLIDLLKKDVQ